MPSSTAQTNSVVGTSVALGLPIASAVLREGWVLKKRRKKMQGFARRYFTLYQSGILTYAFDRGQPIRDQVSLHHSAISTAPGRRDIHIDSNTTFHIKCLSTEDFDEWMSAFRRFIGPGPESRKSTTIRHLTRQGSISVNKSGAVLEEMTSTITDLEEAILALTHDDSSPKKVLKPKGEKEKVKGEKGVLGLFKRTSHHSAMHDALPEVPEKSPTQRVHDALETLKTQHAALLKSNQALALMDIGQSLRSSPLPITNEEEESSAHRTYSPSASFSMPIARKRTSVLTTTTSESLNEWFDADSDGAEEFILDIPPAQLESREPSKLMSNDSRSSLGHSSVDTDIVGEPARDPSEASTIDPTDGAVQVIRRTHLPAAPVGDEGSLFAILKKNVGKDLSTIAFPITFNEPLTLLQRAAEEVEYYELLNLAAAATDPTERFCYVVAFAVSSYAHTRHRSGRKGFNPMLGETFEDVRMKFIAEKVRHNPLEMAYHAEGPNWELTATSAGKTKFWGKSLEVIPLGTTYLKIGDDNFEWKKPSSFMRNLMVGTKYLEHVGKMTVENTHTQGRSVVEFKPSGYWGASNMVSGAVYSPSGKVVTQLEGKWDDQMSQMLDASHFRILWRVAPYPKDAHEYYGFTSFGITLNEITSDIEGKLPPTDSRRRPDVRALEEGQLDVAEREKTRVEEAQRERRRKGDDTQPRWFKQVGEEWEYIGGYWEARAQGWKGSNVRALW
ncbi:oxysterol binding protein [Mycena alexandri]|uniref:Oxysterol binding protein n=1 Tax=Mycena alexandri TaxID=1745969 RepID=A0AAD6X812_9AGAR|nr:oxysterol binding protein [Mycena alexandri]